MASRRLSMSVLAAIVVASLLQISCGQTTHTVGDSLGWTVPPAGASAYSTWAASKTFLVGDRLVFNYSSGRHDVAEVTRENFDSCGSSNTISLNNTAPSIITLTTAATHYYICTVPNHCSLGQKLAINVAGSSIATPPATSTTPSSPAPTTPESAATSLGVAGLSATFLAFFVGLFL